jgi:ABC-2 type transport system permease protein
VLIALLAIYLITIMFYYMQNPGFPFAQDKTAAQGGAVFIKIMGLMVTAAALGLMHYFLLRWSAYAGSLLIPLYLCLIYYVNRILVYKKITWENVDRANQYA